MLSSSVVISSRTQESIDQALQKISPSDKFVDRIAGYRVDTGSEAEVAEGLKYAVSKFGSLQILINGVGGGRGKAPLVETDMAQFETVLKLNLTVGAANEFARYGDHYKWRAMRANGVSEKFITGDGSDFETNAP